MAQSDIPSSLISKGLSVMKAKNIKLLETFNNELNHMTGELNQALEQLTHRSEELALAQSEVEAAERDEDEVTGSHYDEELILGETRVQSEYINQVKNVRDLAETSAMFKILADIARDEYQNAKSANTDAANHHESIQACIDKLTASIENIHKLNEKIAEAEKRMPGTDSGGNLGGRHRSRASSRKFKKSSNRVFRKKSRATRRR